MKDFRLAQKAPRSKKELSCKLIDCRKFVAQSTWALSSILIELWQFKYFELASAALFAGVENGLNPKNLFCNSKENVLNNSFDEYWISNHEKWLTLNHCMCLCKQTNRRDHVFYLRNDNLLEQTEISTKHTIFHNLGRFHNIMIKEFTGMFFGFKYFGKGKGNIFAVSFYGWFSIS